jgi:hypothetical protein
VNNSASRDIEQDDDDSAMLHPEDLFQNLELPWHLNLLAHYQAPVCFEH